VTNRLPADGAQETLLERIAGWCLWITVWGPIPAILASFQDSTEYSFFITYRQVVFPALLVQIRLRLAQPSGLSIWKTVGLVALAALQNPIQMIHLGSVWPWRAINAATVVLSFMGVAEVRDRRVARHLPARSEADAPPPNARAEATKTILLGVAWIAGASWFLLSAVGNPIADLRLTLDATTTSAKVLDTWEDVQDGDDGRANFYHSMSYAFLLPDGREVHGATGSQDGRLPPELVNAPQAATVDVEYVAEDPTVNRLKGYGSSSFADWLFRKILLGAFLLALLVWPGVKMMRDGVIEFRGAQSAARPLAIESVGRSAGVGSRRALAGSVTTATVLPVMSKNSTEYPSSGVPGTAYRPTTVPTSPARSPRSVTSRVRITSPYMSKGMSYLRVHPFRPSL